MYNCSDLKRIPWNRKEIKVVGKWFEANKKRQGSPTRFMSDARNHLDDIVPYVHLTHAINPSKLDYGYQKYLNQC
jgi:hypothetical protein